MIRFHSKQITIANLINVLLWNKLIVKYKWWKIIKMLWKWPFHPNVVKLSNINTGTILIQIIGISEIRLRVSIRLKYSKDNKPKTLNSNLALIKHHLWRFSKIPALIALLIDLCLISAKEYAKKIVHNRVLMMHLYLT